MKQHKPWYTRKTNIGLIGLAILWGLSVAGIESPAWVMPFLLALAGYGANNNLGGAADNAPPVPFKKEEL